MQFIVVELKVDDSDVDYFNCICYLIKTIEDVGWLH